MADPDIMKDLCLDFLKNEYKRAENADPIACVTLNEENTIKLAQKILVMPLEDKNVLFGYYCFAFPKNSIAEIFNIENVSGQLRYVQELLSFSMGLEEEEISQESMEEACKLALQNYVEEVKLDIYATPVYSARFRRKLRKIKAAQKTSDLILSVMKRVAVFLVVCSVGFSAVLMVNVEAREKFFAWVIETFPEFSTFSPNITPNYKASEKDLGSFSFQYIPEGYVLEQTISNITMISYEYRNEAQQSISILITTESQQNLNTENIETDKIRFKNTDAFKWQKDGQSYFVWDQDDLFFEILGDCNLEEAQKIAETVEKNNL